MYLMSPEEAENMVANMFDDIAADHGANMATDLAADTTNVAVDLAADTANAATGIAQGLMARFHD